MASVLDRTIEPCDPQGLLAAALQPTHAVTDSVLAWLINLPDGLDPAWAAREALDGYLDRFPCPNLQRKQYLLTVLGEISRHPHHKLMVAKEQRIRTLN